MKAQEIPYGDLERDLCRLVGDRVREAILSVLQITETTGQAYLVTVTAATQAAGMWAGALSVHHDMAEPVSLPEALEALAMKFRDEDGS